MSVRRRAFTLIELLVVIAIVAILAVIVVVNLMEAQTRSKVTRVKADIRTFFIGLEAYAVDEGHYPYPRTLEAHFLDKIFELTTPIAYLSTVDVLDPFKPLWTAFEPGTILGPGKPEPAGWKPSYSYFNFSLRGSYGQHWLNPDIPHPLVRYAPFEGCCIVSVGPDRDYDGMNYVSQSIVAGEEWYGVTLIYDPSNGTNSSGDIGRWNGRPAYFSAF